MAGWLGTYRPRASETAVRYWLLALARDYPAADPAPLDLHGADLTEWEFRGAAARPLNLRRANFRGTRLTAARFQDADLSQADFTEACAWRAEFHSVRGDGLRLERVDLRGSMWRECQVQQPLGGDSAAWGAAAIIRCTAAPQQWPQAIGDDGAISWCGKPPALPISLPAATVLASRLDYRCGHTSQINACAWSPDGTRILSASFDRTLKVWDARAGICLLTLQGHQSWVLACDWSHDGSRILSASGDGTLKTWAADSGVEELTLLHGPGDQSAALDLPGNRVLWADTGAWRQLGWRWIDPATNRLRMLPAEHFGPLPGTPNPVSA